MKHEETASSCLSSKAPKRRLRPLLPVGDVIKPAEDNTCPKQDETTQQRQPHSGRCGVVQCRKLECNLRSHRCYAATKLRPGYIRRRSTLPYPSAFLRPPLSDSLLDQVVSRIERSLSDGSSTIPFHQEASTAFRALAHHYFAHQMDRLIRVFSPHLDRQKYKSTMTEHALSNDIFCICITANAKTDLLMRGRICRPDRASEMVYAATAHVLRQQLGHFRKTDIDWLLVLVVALTGFDLAFNRTASLKSHHAALHELINMKGGAPAIGHTSPYVISTDRFLALFTGQYPILKQTPLIPVSSNLAGLVSPYGEAFEEETINRHIDSCVVDYCLEQCQLIHLIESSNITLSPEMPPTADPSVLPYFLHLRDRLNCDGTNLFVRYHENQNSTVLPGMDNLESNSSLSSNEKVTLSKSRCVLLAALVVEYRVAHEDYYTIKGPFMARQLKSVLEKQPSSEWAEHVDMLMWLLFVLATLVVEWEGHEWVKQQLRCWLKFKHDGRWPRENWEEEQVQSLKRFMWSTKGFQSDFARVCRELAS